MTGLSKITDKILDEARAEATAILDEADAECVRILAEYKKKAEAITFAANADAKREATEIVTRTRSEEMALQKRLTLNMKGEMIDKAFATAKKDLLSLSGSERLNFLAGLLTATLLCEWADEQTRDEIYGIGDDGQGSLRIYEVLLNVKDREHFGEALLNEFKRRTVGKDIGDLPSRVRLSEDCANIEGGFVIRVGRVEINCSVDSLIESLCSELEPQVARILFPEA